MAISHPSPQTLRRIAVYRPCGLGDAAQVTPLFQQIHSDCPGAEVHFFTSEGIPLLFEGSPFLSGCRALKTEVLKSKAMSLGGFPVWREIGKRGPWDLLINLDFQFRRSLLVRFSNSRWKAGLASLERRIYSPYHYSIHLNPNERENEREGHTSLTYLKLWEAITGFQDSGFGYDLRHLLNRPSAPLPVEVSPNFVCLAPGTGNVFSHIPTKKWPFEHWRQLAGLISQSGLSVIWIGTAEERTAFEPLPFGVDLMGKLNLVQLAKLLAASTMNVAHDSGPFHLALAVGGRALGIYGSTSVTRLGPFRAKQGLTIQKALPCVPCLQAECTVQLPELEGSARPYCLTELTPAEVFDRFQACLLATS